jgi:hypothetical protein
MEPPRRVSIYANHNCHSFHHWGHFAQSLGRVGLSSRHLPCDSRSTYWVPVRCVQNLESLSIDWRRCEVLSAPRLFSVSFWKCKVILCSSCISVSDIREWAYNKLHIQRQGKYDVAIIEYCLVSRDSWSSRITSHQDPPSDHYSFPSHSDSGQLPAKRTAQGIKISTTTGLLRQASWYPLPVIPIPHLHTGGKKQGDAWTVIFQTCTENAHNVHDSDVLFCEQWKAVILSQSNIQSEQK